MKCPKCEYLGFETGERCKHCGYDFSLLASTAFDSPSDPDITIRADDFSDESMDTWLNDLDTVRPDARRDTRFDEIEPRLTVEPIELEVEPPSHPALDDLETIGAAPLAMEFDRGGAAEDAAERVEPALPFFNASDRDDDTPLIALPQAPRPPLAVRRTPDVPRLRAVSRLRAVEAAFDLHEDLSDDSEEAVAASEAAEPGSSLATAPAVNVTVRRLAAAVVDNLILLAIDAGVVYFTLRMAGLETSEWRLIPPVPMAMFLGMMAFAYFTAFTAVGGQTIGKMAAGIRVVGAERRAVDGMGAARRTLAAVISYLTVGLAYLPGLFGDRRAVHDRIARTRIVAHPSA